MDSANTAVPHRPRARRMIEWSREFGFSVYVLRQAIRSGALRAHQVSRGVYIVDEDFNAWLDTTAVRAGGAE